jgi:hypothetical protein
MTRLLVLSTQMQAGRWKRWTPCHTAQANGLLGVLKYVMNTRCVCVCVLCSAVQIFNRFGHKVKCFHLPDYTPANTVAWARTNVGKLLCITWVHSSWNEIIINIWKKEQKYPSDWNISSNSKIIYLLLPLTMQFSSNGWMKGKMVCITFYKQIYTYWVKV